MNHERQFLIAFVFGRRHQAPIVVIRQFLLLSAVRLSLYLELLYLQIRPLQKCEQAVQRGQLDVYRGRLIRGLQLFLVADHRPFRYLGMVIQPHDKLLDGVSILRPGGERFFLRRQMGNVPLHALFQFCCVHK